MEDVADSFTLSKHRGGGRMMARRPNVDRIWKDFDRSTDIAVRLSGVQRNLAIISNVISQLSIRKATDPDAEEFMRNQFIYALAGGHDPHQILVHEKEYDITDKLKPKFSQMIGNYSKLVEHFLRSSTLDESYLGIIDAAEVGCHHPKLSSLDEPCSALALHGKTGLCQSCNRDSEFHLGAYHLSNGVMNPYRCWRRGHRSGEFGFIYRITMGVDKHTSEWKITRNKGRQNHRMFSSNNVMAGLQYEKNRGRFEQPIPAFDRLEESLSNQMMVSIHVVSDAEIALDEIDEIKSLLPSQLLVSRHIDLKNSIKQEGDYENLPAQLEELINSIHQTWSTVAPSIDNQGILGIAIVQQGCDELEDIIRTHLEKMQFNLEEKCDFDAINPLLKPVIIHKSGNKAQFAICLKLDPIFDIGGALHRL